VAPTKKKPDVVVTATTTVPATPAEPARHVEPTPAEATASPGLPSEPTIQVERVAVVYHGVTVDIERLEEGRWRLSATLSYITTSPVPIQYDEVFSGTYEQALAHARERAEELARLKAAHDAVHIRINEMSAGDGGAG
jgi:hypothetical protein